MVIPVDHPRRIRRDLHLKHGGPRDIVHDRSGDRGPPVYSLRLIHRAENDQARMRERIHTDERGHKVPVLVAMPPGYLGRPGLAANTEIRNLGGLSGPGLHDCSQHRTDRRRDRRVQHAPDDFRRVRCLLAVSAHGTHDMRAHQISTVRHGAVGGRELQRSDRDALTERDIRQLDFRPADSAGKAVWAVGGGKRRFRLSRQAAAGQVEETELLFIIIQLLCPKPQAELSHADI